MLEAVELAADERHGRAFWTLICLKVGFPFGVDDVSMDGR